MGEGGALDAPGIAPVHAVSVLVPLLFMALVQAQTALDAGLAAAAAGNSEDAVRLLGEADAAQACPYECLLALGIAQGRLGQLGPARTTLDRAVTLDKARPEALVERGGVFFLEGRYEEAARDLARGLALRKEDYTRDLLASALHLAGRSDEALRVWNQAGLPIVQSLRIEGLSHTKDAVARRELRLAVGDVLDVHRLRESRAGLEEVGIFDRITLRPLPLGEGKADLEVALLERHGFGAPTDLVVGAGVGALQKVLRVRYSNLSGSGITLGGLYRWQENRPEGRLFITWPRPLGLPVYLQAQGMRGRQVYEIGSRFESRYRGAQAAVRKVLGARTVAEIGLSGQNRRFSDSREEARPGTLVEGKVAVERRWVETRRLRLSSSLQYSSATGALGSAVDSSQLLAGASFFGYVAPPEGSLLERSVIAIRLRGGWSSSGTPVDRWFAPGASPEMELPLRAHFRTRDGVLGVTPMGRKVALANVEWRRRLHDGAAFGVGIALHCDLAHIGSRESSFESAESSSESRSRSLQDVGVGLRLKVGPSTLLRFDYSHGLADGKNALSFGVGQLF